MSFKLIKVDDLKSITKGETDPKFDTLLDEILIPAVSQLFANYCNRPDFDKKVRTEYFSPGENCSRLYLKSPPIDEAVGAQTPTPVRVWADTASPRTYASATELTNGTDFFVHEDEGIIEKTSSFYEGLKTVKVTYTGGYLTGHAVGCPADLRLAAITQTKIFFDRREQYGMTGQSMDGGSINLLSILTLPKQVTLILDEYAIPHV